MSPSDWEHFFTEEALTVEEMLSSGDFLHFEQSKMRIALENKILDWTKFKDWILERIQCSVLKSQISPEQINTLKNKYNENKKTFSHYGIWSNDLIPLEIWDNSLIVLGIYPTENLISIPHAIFVLCPPSVINLILETKESDLENEEINKDSSSLSLLNIDPSIVVASDVNFSKMSMDSRKNTQTQATSTKSLVEVKNEIEVAVNEDLTTRSFSIWSKIDSKHTKSCALARKQFDAYVVLKIYNEQTHFFKMDEDLEKEKLNTALFNYDLNIPNAFAKVYKSGATESFSLEELSLNILDFKYACISPLKLGQQILGFLMGFKLEATNQEDEKILATISEQNAA